MTKTTPHLISRRSFALGAGATATASLFAGQALADEPLKVGYIYIGPPGDHGWTFAHDQARKAVDAHFGDKVKTSFVENVAEGPDAERVIRELAQAGNQLIFTTSFGYMNQTIKMAKTLHNVKFEHATGYLRAPNVATYNARFYEGRTVVGTIAGMMSKTGTIGYIASFPIPEVVMGINAIQLAGQKVNPNFKTKVLYVSTWYDPAKEADAAKALIDQGCDMITQHTDSAAPLQACDSRGVYAFGQASNMQSFAPKAHLTAIMDNWAPYYIERVQKVLDKTWTSGDVWGGFKEKMVQMAPYNDAMPANVRAAADSVQADIISGKLKPFSGPLTDQKGVVKYKAGEAMDDGALSKMDWYVAGVQS